MGVVSGTPKKYLPGPNQQQPIGRVGSQAASAPAVMIDPDFYRWAVSLVERVNDLEKRLAALEP